MSTQTIKQDKKEIERKPLTVRIDTDVLDWLTAFAEAAPGRSQAYIVERALEHVRAQRPYVQDDILKGRLDFFELAGRLIESEAWGDHAFKRGWPAWAIEIYSYVAEQSDPIPGIKRLSWYKLGSSWLNFAMVIRREILLTKATDKYTWERYYMAAIESLQFSVAYHEAFSAIASVEENGSQPTGLSAVSRAPQTPNGAVYYNTACGWALIAQYLIEKNDGPSGILVRKAKDKVKQVVDSFHQEHDWASDHGELPGEELTKALNDPLAKKALRNALITLNRIHTGPTRERTSIPMNVTYWLFDYAEQDPDFALLRKTEPEFTEIVQQKRASESIMSAFEKLKKLVPDEILSFVPRLENLAGVREK